MMHKATFLADRIRYYRAVNNLSQRELAQAANMSYGQIANIENSAKKEVLLGTAIRLCNALELDNPRVLEEPIGLPEREELERILVLRRKLREEKIKHQKKAQQKRYYKRRRL